MIAESLRIQRVQACFLKLKRKRMNGSLWKIKVNKTKTEKLITVVL
jgi:hypothetical protein